MAKTTKVIDNRAEVAIWYRRGLAALATRRRGRLVRVSDVMKITLREAKEEAVQLSYKRAGEVVGEDDGRSPDAAEKAARFAEKYVREFGTEVPDWLDKLPRVSSNHIRRVLKFPPAKQQSWLKRANAGNWTTHTLEAAIERAQGDPDSTAIGGPYVATPANTQDLLDRTFTLTRNWILRCEPGAKYDKAWPTSIARRDKALVRQISDLRDALERLTEGAARLEIKLAALVGKKTRLDLVVAVLEASEGKVDGLRVLLKLD
jgi:hypothetical protein